MRSLWTRVGNWLSPYRMTTNHIAQSDGLTGTLMFEITLDVDYAGATPLGDPGGGVRAVYPVRGGRFAGDRLSGRVTGGVDWVHWRPDGAMVIDVRLTLVTDDGAAIGMTYAGLVVGDAAQIAGFKSGAVQGVNEIYIRTTPRFTTGDARYSWLNRVIAVGMGQRTADGAGYRVFAVD